MSRHLGDSLTQWLASQSKNRVERWHRVLLVDTDEILIQNWIRCCHAVNEIWVLETVYEKLKSKSSGVHVWKSINEIDQGIKFDLILIGPRMTRKFLNQMKHMMSTLHPTKGCCVIVCRRETIWQKDILDKHADTVLLEDIKLELDTLQMKNECVHIDMNATLKNLSTEIVAKYVDSFVSEKNLNLDIQAAASLIKNESNQEVDGYFTVVEPGYLYVLSNESIASDASKVNWWPNGKQGEFHNFGLSRWSQIRNEWIMSTRGERLPAPSPVPYDQVVSGLASLRRTHELPRPMRLADVIDIYLDIWESQDGY